MSRRPVLWLLLFVSIALMGVWPVSPDLQAATEPGWRDRFDVEPKDLATIGRSAYFILEPGYRLTLEGWEDGKAARLVITVLNETQPIGDYDTRVVEERESLEGKLAEVSRNYFAIHPRTGDVYYFGEDVEVYEHDEMVSHEGAWRHGVGGARFGLMMPGEPAVGQRYYQELAPQVAMDRAEVVSLTIALDTPAGAFNACLKTRETTPVEPGDREFKIYAPGVGLVQDGALLITGHTPPP